MPYRRHNSARHSSAACHSARKSRRCSTMLLSFQGIGALSISAAFFPVKSVRYVTGPNCQGCDRSGPIQSRDRKGAVAGIWSNYFLSGPKSGIPGLRGAAGWAAALLRSCTSGSRCCIVASYAPQVFETDGSPPAKHETGTAEDGEGAAPPHSNCLGPMVESTYQPVRDMGNRMALPVLSRVQAEDHDPSTGGYCGESRQPAEGRGTFSRAKLRRSILP